MSFWETSLHPLPDGGGWGHGRLLSVFSAGFWPEGPERLAGGRVPKIGACAPRVTRNDREIVLKAVSQLQGAPLVALTVTSLTGRGGKPYKHA